MSEEPRRSGRATKGQHTKASSSPPPAPKPTAKAAIAKTSKKSTRQAQAEDQDDDETIRCICANDNPNDTRAFISCDACSVWQHNICMGMPVDDEDVPDHYFCEECRPEEHGETLQAIERGEKIWEVRNKIYQREKKMSKSRKSKGGAEIKLGWLKKDINGSGEGEEAVESPGPAVGEGHETGSKRKRDVKDETEAQQQQAQELQEQEQEVELEPEPAPASKRASRSDKRRKSSAVDSKAQADPDTAIVEIDQLPADRQKIAHQLSRIITGDIQERSRAGFRIPDGHTARSLGDLHASRIEYALQMNHGSPKEQAYGQQFRTLNANLKRNKLLIEQLLSGSLTADELSTMSSGDLASEDLQKERAAMKAEADRQSTIVQSEQGPKYRRTHKGDEIIEDELTSSEAPVSRPVRQSVGDSEMGGMNDDVPPDQSVGAPTVGSPTQSAHPPISVNTTRASDAGLEARRQSSHNFDMNNIWAKTAHSPTTTASQTAPRPLQRPPRRRSSVQPRNDQQDGAKDDPDVDRMLQEDDETYSPADFGPASGDIVWCGQVVQISDESSPTVNARFVAGRDVSDTISWRELLPAKLNIDGRLPVPRAEDYLCGLQWSSSSDVAVLALTPYDNKPAFDAVFEYFHTRDRYAVVNRDKPLPIKDLYIIPVEAGARLPDHIEMLEHCSVKQPVEERLLLATLVVVRAPGSPPVAPGSPPVARQQTAGSPTADAQPQATNGHLPIHLRAGPQGPAGSPLNASGPTFSPSNKAAGTAAPLAGYGTGASATGSSPFPPNPYNAQDQHQHLPYPVTHTQPGLPLHSPPQAHVGPQGQPGPHPAYPMPAAAASAHSNPLVGEVLGALQFSPTAQQILLADPNIQRTKLENLKYILESDPATRTDIGALHARLMGGQS